MKLIKASPQETFEGDGVVVNRLFPIAKRMNFDPFVLWDHFAIDPGHGFSEHPHRGFEAITYMLSGSMHHKDNLGNDSWVDAGGAQVFCAGRGIRHSEMPAEKGQSAGIQLWINLAKNDKGIEPKYQQVLSEQLPIEGFDGGHCIHIVGDESPIMLHTKIVYQHIKLEKDAQYNANIRKNHQSIIYVLDGSIGVAQESLNARQAWLIEQNQTENFSINAITDTEFMFCTGIPHKEPIHQHGPFVD